LRSLFYIITHRKSNTGSKQIRNKQYAI